MTHHGNSNWFIADKVMNAVTHPFYMESDVLVDYNFGLLRFDEFEEKEIKDYKLTIEVKDDLNNVRLSKRFLLN